MQIKLLRSPVRSIVIFLNFIPSVFSGIDSITPKYPFSSVGTFSCNFLPIENELINCNSFLSNLDSDHSAGIEPNPELGLVYNGSDTTPALVENCENSGMLVGNEATRHCNNVVLPTPFSPKIIVHCAGQPLPSDKSSVCFGPKQRTFSTVSD